MGRDSAKAAKKTANSSAGSAASVEYAARKQDIREPRLSILQDEAVAKKRPFPATKHPQHVITID
jgi:hypothetical protein